MTLNEIKLAVDSGLIVHWKNSGYKVIKDNIGQYLIKSSNGHCVGLYGSCGLNGEENDFYTVDTDNPYCECWGGPCTNGEDDPFCHNCGKPR